MKPAEAIDVYFIRTTTGWVTPSRRWFLKVADDELIEVYEILTVTAGKQHLPALLRGIVKSLEEAMELIEKKEADMG